MAEYRASGAQKEWPPGEAWLEASLAELRGAKEEAVALGDALASIAVSASEGVLRRVAPTLTGPPMVEPTDTGGVSIDIRSPTRKPAGVLVYCEPDGSFAVFAHDGALASRRRFDEGDDEFWEFLTAALRDAGVTNS